ncbi:XRE family transcriptional regulator [Clostridium botulinum]|uniref:helix-turn-helix domain-containing protein n=1 Tax=Clostridium botulinum TaxID=1491 RepID=UPI00016BBD65|nr:helix-turn-helix transcriptional regulator [Clostridium botulinum]EDT87304.1 MATE efflux family protein [Clostridium botulinum Bf]MBN3409973.1 XRE family transcriptional regulator [Clostridium botulinum]MBY6797109.1 helix-turn-helix transcriptional regulator [Clostridium botulinum]MBY6866469.1 helix-turn-helix transcriptional regulator [Clostridium botulinum]MBY6872965.1 helix-turn-helix transcriptional regulator [Clostridium botulinum]
MKLGEKIRSIRKKKGYSILQIKELTGLSKSTISELENDKSSPTAETLQKIATALNVHVSDFFNDSKETLSEDMNHYYEAEQQKHSRRSFADEIEFKTAESAMKFILQQPSIMGFGGFDASKMSDQDIIDFANELLNIIKMLGPKYNK